MEPLRTSQQNLYRAAIELAAENTLPESVSSRAAASQERDITPELLAELDPLALEAYLGHVGFMRPLSVRFLQRPTIIQMPELTVCTQI